jgi:hypothetical protein
VKRQHPAASVLSTLPRQFPYSFDVQGHHRFEPGGAAGGPEAGSDGDDDQQRDDAD